MHLIKKDVGLVTVQDLPGHAADRRPIGQLIKRGGLLALPGGGEVADNHRAEVAGALGGH